MKRRNLLKALATFPVLGALPFLTKEAMEDFSDCWDVVLWESNNYEY